MRLLTVSSQIHFGKPGVSQHVIQSHPQLSGHSRPEDQDHM